MPIEEAKRLQARMRGEKPATAAPKRSSHEAAFDRQLADADLPAHLIEQQLVPGRKFRTDYCWPAHRVALELDGTVRRGNGDHQTESGITSDCQKALRLAALGWLPLRITATMVASGEAIELVGRVLARIEDTRSER